MNAEVEFDDTAAVSATSVLRTLVVADLVESTALVERLGDRAAAALIRKHDRVARTIADRHGGQEIDKTDGFLMMFDRPIQAVAFALDYQRGLKQLNAAEQTSLSARVGIHVGDVVVWDNTSADIAKGAKPVEVEGLVKPIASRLMNLALPGQILLSNIAYALAHRAQGELGIQLEKVRWRTHGRYRFRGVPDPVPVFEVGEEGLAPLKAPPWSGKAYREVPFWRRPATVVIEALVLLALVAIPLYTVFKPEPAIAFANRDWVVVGNLHNLTGETVFDEALESALRIGLEQSRYVNVLPDLKVRDTVKRMERDPDTTRVDRAVGSEVAIRDGAKALILPTIAEIGGRVRITAEVIDPHTQATVYSESADGTGAESVLPSLDLINQRLRVRLGEALASVTTSSLPLEKVATKNLDALRAYSLGNRNYVRGKFNEASELYMQALAIDPEFASAHVRIASIFASAHRAADAEDSLGLALARRERLTPRDALYAEVLLVTMRTPDSALPKWAALAESYPDFITGIGGYAYVSWRDANRFDSRTLDLAATAASPRNPAATASQHLYGILLLGRGEYAEAEKAFAAAETAGLVYSHYHSATHAAQRRFDEASSTLARSPIHTPIENPAVSGAHSILEVSFLVDQGRFDAAAKRLAEIRSRIPAGNHMHRLIDGVALVIVTDAMSSDRDQQRRRLQDALAALNPLLDAASGAERTQLVSAIVWVAYLAARLDDTTLARNALLMAGADVSEGYSASFKLRQVAEAEIDRASGNAELAIEKLKKTVDGSELYLTHVALLDAQTSAGWTQPALEEVRWLASHRGRAYAEYNVAHMLMPFNVEQSNLALLSGAELSLAQDDAVAARTMLKSFQAAWPQATQRTALASRIARIQAGLPDGPSP